jgi:hypothetical protein
MIAAIAPAQTAPQNNAVLPIAPLPNPADLLQRAIASETKLAAEQERYECRVADDTTELDGKGHVKKMRPRSRSSSTSTASRSTAPSPKTAKTSTPTKLKKKTTAS